MSKIFRSKLLSYVVPLILVAISAFLQNIPFFDYMSSVTFSYLVFIVLLTLAFQIIQIPFALISRGAVYVCLLAQTFFIVQFFNYVSVYGIVTCEFPRIPLLLLFSVYILTTFYEYAHMLYRSGNNSFLYFLISGVVAVVLLFAFSYSSYFSLTQPIEWSLALTTWLYNIPVVGSIFSILALPAFILITLYALFNLFLIASSAISSKKKQNFSYTDIE